VRCMEEGGGGGGGTRAEDVAARLPAVLWDQVVDELMPMMLADETSSVRASAITAIAYVSRACWI